MDIEKSSGHRKAQMLVTLRAEKQRHAAKAEFRRKRFTEALEDHLEREAEALRQKHGVPQRCDFLKDHQTHFLTATPDRFCPPFIYGHDLKNR